VNASALTVSSAVGAQFGSSAPVASEKAARFVRGTPSTEVIRPAR
jgi:hypothetical protein